MPLVEIDKRRSSEEITMRKDKLISNRDIHFETYKPAIQKGAKEVCTAWN